MAGSVPFILGRGSLGIFVPIAIYFFTFLVVFFFFFFNFLEAAAIASRRIRDSQRGGGGEEMHSLRISKDCRGLSQPGRRSTGHS